MKKKTIFSVATLVGLGLITAGVASAFGGFGIGLGSELTPEETATRFEERVQSQAEILETDVDTVKNAWAEGTRPHELAEELGIDKDEFRSRIQEQHKVRMQDNLQSLVDQGVITQDQADQKLQFMEDKMADGEGHGCKMGQRGGGGFGMKF
ncbi:hypothetical protein KKG41_06200 [Patescibacteria group bacterium]|nr:hypothetical protein [Patescibacteria group bacterium]MBU1891085.1 hypothetical protein [Patescibacteria group bacterium]